MIKLALIGKNIAHSKSKQMYERIYNTSIQYDLLDYDNADEIENVECLFRNYDGVSITAPYKEFFLDKVQVDDKYKGLDAINCLYNDNGIYRGVNTDYLAIEKILVDCKYIDRNIIVLGNGAMVRVLSSILSKLKKEYTHYYRAKDGDLNNIRYPLDENLLVINACSRSFNFSSKLSAKTIFWDLNYAHQFHEENLVNKLKYVDGIDLLFLQAKFATQFWKISPL